MDPVSALGVAAAVVQFVEFATKRCRDVLNLYETGSTSFFKGVAFDHTARDFLGFAEDFKRSQKLKAVSDQPFQTTDDVCVKPYLNERHQILTPAGDRRARRWLLWCST